MKLLKLDYGYVSLGMYIPMDKMDIIKELQTQSHCPEKIWQIVPPLYTHKIIKS